VLLLHPFFFGLFVCGVSFRLNFGSAIPRTGPSAWVISDTEKAQLFESAEDEDWTQGLQEDHLNVILKANKLFCDNKWDEALAELRTLPANAPKPIQSHARRVQACVRMKTAQPGPGLLHRSSGAAASDPQHRVHFTGSLSEHVRLDSRNTSPVALLLSSLAACRRRRWLRRRTTQR
jgi:hypothetical protein